ncbi:MAG: 3-deoxy-manno-octulosonate cytidylyltransferase [Gammaproteobacteria bacterium]|nr:3-deoxy-manno-octulosonate cytidylyltransferase [Gammaproteobacteria bacterium]
MIRNNHKAPSIHVIPARYGSSRLPGKPLRELAGKPMVEHVYRRACESGAEQVVIATDDTRIETVARGFGAAVEMTKPEHPSGTDRLAEVVERLGWPDDTIIVNLQGDEPLMPPALVRQVADNLATQPQAAIATLCTPIIAAAEFFDPNVVKLVSDAAGFALYFSRAPIPWSRDAFAVSREQLPTGVAHRRHLGLYAYRASFLRAYRGLTPAPLESIEMLEQLRALWHGYKIHVAETVTQPGPGVDVEADALRVEQALRQLMAIND